MHLSTPWLSLSTALRLTKPGTIIPDNILSHPRDWVSPRRGDAAAAPSLKRVQRCSERARGACLFSSRRRLRARADWLARRLASRAPPALRLGRAAAATLLRAFPKSPSAWGCRCLRPSAFPGLLHASPATPSRWRASTAAAERAAVGQSSILASLAHTHVHAFLAVSDTRVLRNAPLCSLQPTARASIACAPPTKRRSVVSLAPLKHIEH